MPELDTLRGVAVLGVLLLLLLHAFYWRYAGLSFGPWARRFLAATQPGSTGVNLFFVFSGFLIMGILLDSKDKPHFYRRFYTRRALRILPALLTADSPAIVANVLGGVCRTELFLPGEHDRFLWRRQRLRTVVVAGRRGTFLYPIAGSGSQSGRAPPCLGFSVYCRFSSPAAGRLLRSWP